MDRIRRLAAIDQNLCLFVLSSEVEGVDILVLFVTDKNLGSSEFQRGRMEDMQDDSEYHLFSPSPNECDGPIEASQFNGNTPCWLEMV